MSTSTGAKRRLAPVEVDLTLGAGGLQGFSSRGPPKAGPIPGTRGPPKAGRPTWEVLCPPQIPAAGTQGPCRVPAAGICLAPVSGICLAPVLV